MTYNFQTMTKKDLFKARLAGKNGVMDFGFIPRWHRRKFIQFCKDNELVIPFPGGFNESVYKANSRFTYKITYSDSFLWAWLAETIVDIRDIKKDTRWTRLSKFTIKPRKPNDGFNWLQCHRSIIY